MLDALRRGAQSWLAKVLFAILIISFGVFWNVADVFRGFGQGAVARVGKTDISVTQFQRAFQEQMQSVTMRDGSRLSNEQALALKLDQQALDRLIAQAAVKVHARDINLELSEDELARGVRQDPIFAGPDGKFSKMGYDGLLREMGLTEKGFFALRREDELRRQLTDALRTSIAVPKPFIDAEHAYKDETRTIEHTTLDAQKIKVADPDEAKLRETYEANKSEFFTHEFRKFDLLVLSADDLKKEVTLSDDDLKAFYADNKATYDKPELRRIQQIAFKDKAAAEEARKALAGGKKNFLDVAKEAGATEADVNLGLISKDQMIDKTIAEKAFGLKRDEISEVIEGRFATVLVRSIEIQPGKVSTFEEVKEQVRDKLAKEKATAMIQDRIDLVDEGRHAGKTLKEISEEQKLRYFAVEAADAENGTPDGKTALDFPDAAIVLKEVFATSPGAEHDALELPSETFGWYDVGSVTERKQKPFEEVKEAVKTFYIDKEKSRLLDELAGKLVERLKNGEDFAKIVADAGGKAELAEAIRRETSQPGLTTDAIKQAFSLQKGGASYAETSDRASRIVYRVKDIIPAPAIAKEQTELITGELKKAFENELLIAYVDALRAREGVSVDQAQLDRATGASAGQQP